MLDDPTGDFMSNFVPIFIGIIAIIVISTIVISIVKGAAQWSHNNNSPVSNKKSKVITKRTDIQGGGETRAYNHYYVTFQLEEGERIELKVKGDEYGMLVEGDTGELSFQGTRYLGFDRSIQSEIN
ncbi:DUF2500 domain-containing protein [Fictibacillus sp. KU28468]|uniref:DUF2500 domain-containing protein n=1 Tax=Fictibacillus sp. KU28468 TaxID=2991053 RepID=UPI00223E3D50|nr:DUF2500 domain-containing protein [Fictibacillus sp. KU28468]UZJ78539.1 DUF2500 domain-containing protein [Fictibacillus sp. KU28468]